MTIVVTLLCAVAVVTCFLWLIESYIDEDEE